VERGVSFHPKKSPEFACRISAEALKTIFFGCEDFFLREIKLGLEKNIFASVCWIDGLVNETGVSEDVVRPLTESSRLAAADSARRAARLIEQGAVWRGTVRRREAMDDLVSDLTAGYAALVFEGLGLALTFETKSQTGRPVQEATIEKAVKGPRDAFCETLRVNTALVRRRLRTPKLKLLEQTVGRESNTRVALLYIEGIARPELVETVQARLRAIDLDAVLSAGDLEPYVTDHPRSPLPQTAHTERPDKLAAALLQGRAGILVDGLPVGFLLPGTLCSLMRAPEDRADTPAAATFLTLLRWLALLTALTLPALYVAAAVHHQEMLPTQLLVSMVEAEQEVPFGAAAVMLFLLIAFELLQEAGLRLPAPVGQTVSIIGALLVGEAAVSARVASPIAIIVVALAGIAGYNVPNQELAALLRPARIILVTAAALGGMFALTALGAMTVWYACTIDCFGLAWLHPLVDEEQSPIFRVFMRKNQRDYKLRDEEVVWWNRRRQK
jgi:hypothetical protein